MLGATKKATKCQELQKRLQNEKNYYFKKLQKKYYFKKLPAVEKATKWRKAKKQLQNRTKRYKMYKMLHV